MFSHHWEVFSDSTSRSSRPEVFCIKVVFKISAIFTGKHLRWNLFLIKLQGLQHRWKETPTQEFSCEYCGIFKNNFLYSTYLVASSELLYWISKRVFSINRSVRKTFKCSFSIDFAFNISVLCSEGTPQPETIFSRVDFLAVIIYQYFLFLYMQKKHTAFTWVNPALFLLPFIIFIVLLSFSVNFEFNFGLNFNTINLFHLNRKISFGFLPIKEKSLDLLELAPKMQEIWMGASNQRLLTCLYLFVPCHPGVETPEECVKFVQN